MPCSPAGCPRLEEALERAAAGSRVLPGDEAFKLYDTYGLPRDFIEDLASNQGLRFDAEGFAREMEGAAREGARQEQLRRPQGRGLHASAPTADARTLWQRPATRSRAMPRPDLQSVPVVALFDDAKQQVWTLPAGWPERLGGPGAHTVLRRGRRSGVRSGLARGRAGALASERRGPSRRRAAARAPDRAARPARIRIGGLVIRRSRRRRCAMRPAATTPARTCSTRALRQVLGPHVKQAGLAGGARSPALRLRALPARSPPTSSAASSDIVNEAILRNEPVTTRSATPRRRSPRARWRSSARSTATACAWCPSAMGLQHRAVRRHARPRHRRHRALLITEESGVAAGVRRVEALTGLGALAFARPRSHDVRTRPHRSSTPAPTMWSRGSRRGVQIAGEGRQGSRPEAGQGGRRTTPAARRSRSPSATSRWSAGGSTMPARTCCGPSPIRSSPRSPRGSFSSPDPPPEGKVAMVASVTGNVTGRLKAGQLVKELAPMVGGGGGGRPDFAEAGGKDPAQIDAMLAAAPEVVQATAGSVSGGPIRIEPTPTPCDTCSPSSSCWLASAVPGVRADLLVARRPGFSWSCPTARAKTRARWSPTRSRARPACAPPSRPPAVHARRAFDDTSKSTPARRACRPTWCGPSSRWSPRSTRRPCRPRARWA